MPTLSNVNPSADSWLDNHSFNQDTNYGNDATILCGAYGEFGLQQRPILEFDLSAIPGDATIVSATLTLAVSTAASAAKAYRVQRCTRPGSWVENLVTWLKFSLADWTAPGGDLDGAVADNFTCPTSTGSAVLNITNNAADAVANLSGIMAMILSKTNPSELAFNQFIFDSRQGTTPPVVEVEYLAGDIDVVATLTAPMIELSASISTPIALDADLALPMLELDAQISNGTPITLDAALTLPMITLASGISTPQNPPMGPALPRYRNRIRPFRRTTFGWEGRGDEITGPAQQTLLFDVEAPCAPEGSENVINVTDLAEFLAALPTEQGDGSTHTIIDLGSNTITGAPTVANLFGPLTIRNGDLEDIELAWRGQCIVLSNLTASGDGTNEFVRARSDLGSPSDLLITDCNLTDFFHGVQVEPLGVITRRLRVVNTTMTDVVYGAFLEDCWDVEFENVTVITDQGNVSAEEHGIRLNGNCRRHNYLRCWIDMGGTIKTSFSIQQGSAEIAVYGCNLFKLVHIGPREELTDPMLRVKSVWLSHNRINTVQMDPDLECVVIFPSSFDVRLVNNQGFTDGVNDFYDLKGVTEGRLPIPLAAYSGNLLNGNPA